MIVINGAEGEGGGQILRNAVALSLLTDQPFRIHNIRAGRERPGLMRQHITAIEAAMKIGNAECDGLAVGATEIVFRPGKITAGDYKFAVGTAGSTSLVLQTVLMPLALTDAPSRIRLEGGTHNMQAPPFDFLDRCFIPIVNRMGPKVEMTLHRHGFYPLGAGVAEVAITPSPLRPLECTERGALRKHSATALIAGIPGEIAKREIDVAKKALDWPEEYFAVLQLPDEQGPGNVLLLEAEYENVTEIVAGFGRVGVRAEHLAKTAAQRLLGYMASTAFAGPYLADQLILPFALVGGTFTTVKPSNHTRTAAAMVERFVERRVTIAPLADGTHLVTVR